VVAACLLALLVFLPGAVSAEPAPDPEAPTNAHRWHTPRRGARPVAREHVAAHPDDWNPLAGPAAWTKGLLKRGGITTDLFLMFFYQWSSDVLFGGDDFGSFVYRSTGDWEIVKDTPLGDAFLEWNLTGSVGFGFDEEDESLAGGLQIGDQSVINTNVVPDTSALDEIFFKQVIADGSWVVIAGRVDQSFHFDVNRIANDAYRQLQAFVFVNNLSIPFPLYGGIGGLISWKATERLTLRIGGGESGSDEPWKFWETLDDGNWYQLAEADLALDVPGLGKGTYRLTPWHNHLAGKDGWGVGGNFDQELGLPWLVAFFRFGVGNGDVTPVERHVSGGLAIEKPFGRSGDQLALGAGWSRPSAPGTRSETFLELQYRVQLTKTLELSPDLQLILNPASNPDTDTIVVPGIRLTLVF
jgi:porin